LRTGIGQASELWLWFAPAASVHTPLATPPTFSSLQDAAEASPVHLRLICGRRSPVAVQKHSSSSTVTERGAQKGIGVVEPLTNFVNLLASAVIAGAKAMPVCTQSLDASL
jgi:hypothetical protein